MQPDDSRGLVFIEMAKNGIPCHLSQVFPVFPLSKYAVSERLGIVSTLWRFSDLKYDFNWPHAVVLVFPDAP